MTQQELVIRGIDLKLDRLLNLLEEQSIRKTNEEKVQSCESEWITLTQACAMHGGYKLSTLRARKDLQPNCGHGVLLGKHKCYKREDVLLWLSLRTPEQWAAYRAKWQSVPFEEGAS